MIRIMFFKCLIITVITYVYRIPMNEHSIAVKIFKIIEVGKFTILLTSMG